MAIDVTHLSELLQQEHKIAVALHNLLQHEEKTLVSDDLPLLEEQQGKHQGLVKQLQDHAEKRLQWMQDNNLPLSSECLLHPAIEQEATISRLWHTLSDQYLLNQDLSAKLAEVTLGLRHRTQQKLNILHGRKNEPNVYNKSGKTNSNVQGLGSIQV